MNNDAVVIPSVFFGSPDAIATTGTIFHPDPRTSVYPHTLVAALRPRGVDALVVSAVGAVAVRQPSTRVDPKESA